MKTFCLIAILGLQSAGDPLPLREGAAWTYVVEDRTAESVTSSRKAVAHVGSTSEIGGEAWTKVSNWLGYERCWLRAAGAKIQLRLDSEEDAPVLTIVNLEAKAGAQWSGTLGDKTLRFRMEGRQDETFGTKYIRALDISVLFGGHEGHGHPAPRGRFRFAEGIGILEARLAQDLDCHSSAMRTYRLVP